MSGQSGGDRVSLSELNEQLTCKLCGGYFIDATTIIECLHSFCRSCIVKYLQNNKYCPICEVQVHKSRPLLNIRPDHTLQDIIYKLVPGCYQNEMRCRREFYSKHPELCNEAMSPEARGEPIESHIYSADESLSLSLEYFNPCTKDFNETNAIKDSPQKPHLKRYLRCPAAVTVFHLQKLIRAKYGLSDAHRVDVMYKEEPLCSNYTLMDVMYIYHWRRKVPLHLSYRIFESSSKRIKLSEDNVNYKKSLTNAGIDSIELKDERSLKREWKEVQLKISETGVMSITDISSTVLKKDTAIENLQHPKASKETITPIVAPNKTDSVEENCGMSKPFVEAMQSAFVTDAQMTKNSAFADSNKVSFITNDVESAVESSSIKNCIQESLAIQHNGNTTRQTSELESFNVSAKSQQDTQGTKDHDQADNIEDKLASQGQKTISQQIAHPMEKCASDAENTEGTNTSTKKVSINNNNDSAELEIVTQKECIKNISETKVGNAGSKIDALSVKLQFQPKIGQVNNTYSKKAPKEKRAILHSMKKFDIKSSTESVKVADIEVRTNCGNIASKIMVPCSTVTSPEKSVAPLASRNASAMDSSSGSDKPERLQEKDNQTRHNQCTSIDVQQALNLLEQKTNLPAQASTESVSRVSQVTNMAKQKLQCSRNGNTVIPSENLVSIAPNSSTSTMSQTTSTFPYTVHDLVTNATLKPKNSSSSCSLQKPLGVSNVTSSTSNSHTSSISQFNMQTPSMGIYPVSTSAKNNCSNTNQSVSIVTATVTLTATTTVTSAAIATSTSTSLTGMCAVPPCPDAIPISFMKPTIRKQEMTAKGTNINEICAKIGSNTTGSKINDICAKIGENSKEKNRIEARNKSDIPDLLKIAKKSASPLSNSDTAIKHIPNIPNVPLYTPSGNTTMIETKSVYPNVKDNIKPILSTSTSATVSTSQVTPQRMSSFKKQSQSIGYKTLRDPPKSWNPTLSKNNYIAVKNQAKEMQNQTQTSVSEGTSKQIPSKPAKIFKMRNMPRYLGNPASGVKPMYGVTNDTKEKEQSTNTKSTTLNMMKIDPKTLSPIVSTVNSPIVSPPPYSPNARSYQNTPFPRDICRNTGSPISPRNSPVNMLSTNPFIPSPTPNTNPRIIYSHFPPPFPDASRFPNPLIRSPIGIPPPSAFHSSLPPSINKLYQRSSYIPQTTGYSPVSQPPAIQRIPPSTHSSSPKASKASSPPNMISSTSFNLAKSGSQSPITSTVDSVALLLSKSTPVAVPVPAPAPVSVSVPVSVPSHREINAFNLSKTGSLTSASSNVVKTSMVDSIEEPSSKQNSSPLNSTTIDQKKQYATTSTETSNNSSSLSIAERKQEKTLGIQKVQEITRSRDEDDHASNAKLAETRRNTETADIAGSSDKREKNMAKVNGEVTTEHFGTKKPEEGNNEETTTVETIEQYDQIERVSPRERSNMQKNNVQADIGDPPANGSKNEDTEKSNEQIQGKKSEVQKNKAET